jgi:streptogrisin D
MPGGGHELRPGHRSVNKKKAMWVGTAAMAVAAGAIMWPQANASQAPAAPEKLGPAAASELAAQFASQLGSAYAGAYYDADTQRITVNVAGIDNGAMARVRTAGAEVRQVRNSAAMLTSGAAKLARQARIPGTAWVVDPRTNQIVVTADRTVPTGNWNSLVSSVRSLGDGVARVQRSTGVFRLSADGGDAIFGGGARCSLGFNVTTQDGSPGFLTAGHCGVAEPEWSDSPNGAPIATIQDATFPGAGDFALATYDDPDTAAASVVDVGNGQLVRINQAAEAVVGQQVFRMGSTTGLHDGTVTGLDATVNYPEGTVTGLIQTDVCAEPGDSGGPLFTATGGAVGLTSGGSGNCTAGGETFFQPVTTALEAVGASIGAE